VGFAGGFRRSELVGIDLAHVEFVGEGVVVTLPRSKTDQEGQGRKVAIPFGGHEDTCPVRALRAWIEAASIEDGPVFRPVNRHGQVGAERLTGRGVALVVKQYIGALGKDTAAYSGHSLRAGFVTAAARGGALSRDIMRQTGHKSEAMVQRYIRDANAFVNNAAGTLGL
jgi:integrase